ncbi:MAG TPA: PmoA family protein [Actinocatenispora sp.]
MGARDEDGTREPAPSGPMLVHEQERSVRLRIDDVELFRYVYRPWDAQRESPRPYLHPVRTLGGDVVSLFRPHDHVWHKGIAWSLSNVGTQNFWGGRTFTPDRGYVQLDDNGTVRHDGFDELGVRDGVARLDERLSWLAADGERMLTERRLITATVVEGAWRLGFTTTMTNVGPDTVPFGSPTTKGRDNAGYSGLFWRGPRSFSDGGRVLMPGVVGADELMGARGPWLAYVGRHDGHGRSSTLLFRDDPGNPTHPTRWFVRTGQFAGVCPAPFFDTEYELPAGGSLTLRYDVWIADGALDEAACRHLVS